MSMGTPPHSSDINYEIPLGPLTDDDISVTRPDEIDRLGRALSTSAFDGPALLRAQHDYIQALHDYSHLSDMPSFIKSQEAFIRVQSAILKQVGVI